MIAKMKKLTLAAMTNDIDDITRELIWLSSVHVLSKSEAEEFSEIQSSSFENTEALLQETRSNISLLKSALDCLSLINDVKRPIFSLPIYSSKNQFEELKHHNNKAVEYALDIDKKIKEISSIKSEINRLKSEIDSLRPYFNCDIPISIENTDSTAIFKGIVPSSETHNSLNELFDQKQLDAVCTLASAGDNCNHIIVFSHKDCAESVLSTLSSIGFSKLSFKDYHDNAKNCAEYIEKKITQCENRLSELQKSLVSIIKHENELKLAYDYLVSKEEQLSLQQKLFSTDSTCILVGYVPAYKTKSLITLLSKWDCCYELSEPGENDDVPTCMVNNRFATPFESVISLYSLPSYKGFDPTFIMSIFYFIIFGMIMQDVGYGLVLLLGCKALSKLMHAKGNMKKMLDMFALCGISTIICGILFGGYFGDLPGKIATGIFGVEKFPDLELLLNPVTNPIGYLALSLGIGAIHLITGMIIKSYMLFKEGNIGDAIFDVVPWLSLFASLGIVFINGNLGIYLIIFSVVFLILTQGRHEKNLIMKLLKGVMSLYDTISYLSDLLSYSRIMALGLSGAIIAQVFNTIGTMGGATVGGIIALVLSFAIGHVLNLALSVLGAFVHTARLQYIEFFNKFYIDGGKPFEPSCINTKYTEIISQEDN